MEKVLKSNESGASQELRQSGIEYAWECSLTDPEDRRAFELGAVLGGQDSEANQIELPGLNSVEKEFLTREGTHRWSQPKLMYMVIVICSICAAIQGMDETVINGAQIFFYPQFGIEDKVIYQGITNGAPYLACAALGCWLTIPLNNFLGRRGVIFCGSLLSIIASLWAAFVGSWWHLVIARVALGLAIGPMSATVPIYAAETTPPKIRGAFCMQWQMWTAFGIMLGYMADLMFYWVKDSFGIVGLRWRLMMAAPLFPALVVATCVLAVPESPRWLMQKGRSAAAYRALCRLRYCKVQAARDLYRMHVMLEEEKNQGIGVGNDSGICGALRKFKDLVAVPRNRRALYASELVMFMQQFCGVNVIAYYSSVIFTDAGFSHKDALCVSLGWGVVNFLFAIPALFTIDRAGRRRLLLLSMPLMAICLFWTGASFFITNPAAKIANVATGIYVFGMIYSWGPGPVPFTYSAEAYPLAVRTYGMSLATATTWAFNFALSMSWPTMQKAFRPSGAFIWYASWNIIGAILVWLLVRETKGKSLEELDEVFSIKTTDYVRGRWRSLRRRLTTGKGIDQMESIRE